MFSDKSLLFGTAFFFFGRGFSIRTSRVSRAISSTRRYRLPSSEKISLTALVMSSELYSG